MPDTTVILSAVMISQKFTVILSAVVNASSKPHCHLERSKGTRSRVPLRSRKTSCSLAQPRVLDGNSNHKCEISPVPHTDALNNSHAPRYRLYFDFFKCGYKATLRRPRTISSGIMNHTSSGTTYTTTKSNGSPTYAPWLPRTEHE